MKLNITKDIFAQHPEFIVGVVFARFINNRGCNSDIEILLRKGERNIMASFDEQPISEHSHILPWREAYKLFGAKPKKYLSSIENLVRRIKRGELIRHINKLVDLYNYISLKYVLPVGGEDLEKIDGDILLTVASQDERPIILLGEQEARAPYADEVIYKDNQGTICRRWNWKEADRTKLTEETTVAVLVIEGLPPVTREVIENATGELANLVKQYCSADVSTEILDASNPQTQEFLI